MSELVLDLGNSGEGKSFAARHLDPDHTFIINIANKRLPWRGSASEYQQNDENPVRGNLANTRKAKSIKKLLKLIDQKREEVKTIIIDDAQYLMSLEFINRVKEDGWGKFEDIFYDFSTVLNTARDLSRDDLYVFINCHTDRKENGDIGLKTVGKATDQYLTPEGLATVVLHTEVFPEEEDPMDRYQFLTQKHNDKLAKSPDGMFPSLFINNDLRYVRACMEAYYHDEDPPSYEEVSGEAEVEVETD